MNAVRAAARCLCLLAVLIASAATASTGIVQMEVTAPRTEGYVIGDTITRVVHLELGGDDRLDEHSLPVAGRIDLWLELHLPRVRRHGASVDVELTYQLVNAPQVTQELVVPQLTLQVASTDHRLPVFVPEWRFTATPIVPVAQRGAAARFNLRPQRPPPLLDVVVRAWLLGATLAAWTVVMGALGWLHFGLPWRAARARPFAQALRELRALRGGEWDRGRQREAFRIVHRALDRAAGCTVLPANVDELFRTHPSLARLRARIESLLQDSRRLFFGPGDAVATTSLDALTDLCRDCRQLERSTP
jgi:mxaA protein